MSNILNSLKIIYTIFKNKLTFEANGGDGIMDLIIIHPNTHTNDNEPNRVRIQTKKKSASRRKRRSLSSLPEQESEKVVLDQKCTFISTTRPGGSYLKPYHHPTTPPSTTGSGNLLPGSPSTGLTSSVSANGLSQLLQQSQQMIFAQNNFSLSSIIQLPSEITQIDIQIVSDKPRIRELLYGKLQNAPFRDHHFSMATDLFSNIHQFQAIIIPCESALGPLWPLHSFANSIIAKLEDAAELKEKIIEFIAEKFLGELTAGSSFMLKHKNMYLIFCCLGMHTPTLFSANCIYNALRSSLLEIQRHNQKIKKISVLSSRSADLIIKKLILPVFPSSIFQEEFIIDQMLIAIENTYYMPESILPSFFFNDLQNKLSRSSSVDELERESLFEAAVFRKELTIRGILRIEEVDMLFNWVEDSSNSRRQIAAASALLQCLWNTNNILPPDITTNMVAAKLFVQNSIALKVLKDLNDKQKIPIFKEITKSDLVVGDLLGKGGTASVYKAKYNNTDVAFKLFHEGTNIQEWRHEVLVMSLVAHPNLVYLYGAGIESNCPFIVMEVVSKGELFEVLHQSQDPISPVEQLNWCLDIAKGMEYLHSIGFIHRDLKSLNVLLTADNRCKITDYGTSRIIDTKSNMTGNIGTAAWMAPEILMNKAYSEKADVYSFAILMYEIYCRTEPYADVQQFCIPMLVCKGTRPTLTDIVPSKISRLIQACWHEKAAKRPTFTKIISTLTEFGTTI